jgi:hypothetical protein
MKGLRVYLSKRANPLGGGHIFYSQRGGGPYYRWRYEEHRGEWQCSRIHGADLSLTDLVSASWKDIPTLLKTTLDQHYVE